MTGSRLIGLCGALAVAWGSMGCGEAQRVEKGLAFVVEEEAWGVFLPEIGKPFAVEEDGARQEMGVSAAVFDADGGGVSFVVVEGARGGGRVERVWQLPLESLGVVREGERLREGQITAETSWEHCALAARDDGYPKARCLERTRGGTAFVRRGEVIEGGEVERRLVAESGRGRASCRDRRVSTVMWGPVDAECEEIWQLSPDEKYVLGTIRAQWSDGELESDRDAYVFQRSTGAMVASFHPQSSYGA